MHKYTTIISESMTANRENDVVRLSSSARSRLSADRKELIEVWTRPDGSSVLLPVKPAYKGDIARAKRNGVKLRNVIFVSSNVAGMFNSSDRKVTWVDKKPRRCAIGSDPEIMLLSNNNNNVIYAGNYVPFNATGVIGSDGPMLEIRPAPGNNAAEHVDNIKDAIANLKQEVRQYVDREAHNRLYFKCIPYVSDPEGSNYTSGGHIHLGISSYLKDGAIRKYNNSDIVFNVLAHVLDLGLGIPMQHLDGDLGLKRRVHYGAPGDIRTLPSRLEYRTLSSTWLLYPDMAETVLQVAHEIVIGMSDRLLEYFRSDNCNTYAFGAVTDDVLGMDMLDDLEDLLCFQGVSANDIEELSLPVLEKLSNDDLKTKFLNMVLNCHPRRINRNIINNWSNSASITDTF